MLFIIPVPSVTDVIAELIGKLVSESIIIDSNKRSHRGLIFLIAYMSSLPTPPGLFEEIKPLVHSSSILKAKSSELLFTGIPTFLTFDHLLSIFLE